MMHGREDVSQFFERRSSALVDAAIACAKATGYARYTTTIRAAWVEAVASVNEGLAEYLPRAETASAEPKAQVNYAADPRFVRMREVAERHRGYGATLQLYLGFLKHFRELYLEVLGPAGGDADKALARDQVRGFFDLAELSIAAAWADVSADVRLRDLQARNRAVTLEKDRYFSVFESLRDPAFLLDRERRLITGNQAAAELFVGEAAAGEIVYLSAMRTRRLPLEEALSGLDLWNPDRPEGVDALWLDTRLGRLCFDLRVRQLHDSVENMRLGYVAILHDVTEHRRATDEAQRAQRAMSQFLATMSHEIRTPLHGVLGATELLHDAGPDEFDGYLDAIEVAGRHLLQTLNKVLDYSRLEARPPTPTTRPINLHAALSDYRGFAATLAQNAGGDFHLKRSARLPKGVEIDWEMTQQVLTNLVSNAVRYSRGAVTLTVGRRAGPPALLRFEVADDGPGVAPEVAKTLFEPFGAVTPGRGATSGSGLGLAISRRLVTAMGGSIGMAGHRGGATFWVELPLAVAKAPSPTARLPASSLAQAETPGALRCLAVDDDTVSLFVTLEHLRRLGIEASQAGTMRAALALADRQDFDLFVLDYHLSDGDGVDLLAELRRRGKIHSGTRAVALTANAELIAAQGGGVAQFDAIIAKPANADALRKALREENAKAGAPPGPWLEGVSPGIVRAMVDAFENQWDSDHSAFVAALDARNPAEAAQIAHRLAGSCAALGFADIAEALKGFEASCRCGLQPPEFTLWQHRLMPILAAAPARALRLAETQALP
ncbi:ATP-binding protein [Amaricoccus sp. B4]|uniref:ATP-binding protein n=1 Tax=Amaricoccus sp. B4 TaxID=3368557 RepID=UPI00371B2BE5